MTDVFPDPGADFLAREALPDLTAPPAEQGHPGVLAAAGLAAAFLAYRSYMKDEIKEDLGPDVNRHRLGVKAAVAYRKFLPKWLALTVPHLVAGYLEGVRKANSGYVPYEVLAHIADGYARELGEHLNQVSAEAMLSGYQAQVNRKVPPLMAARRVADAYGVPQRAMNTLVNVWTSPEPAKLTDRPLPSSKDERARTLIEAQHQLRARQIGENEAFAAESQAKQIVWMYGQDKGFIPKSARRVWITAADEKVCKVCGPLDGVEARVGDKFTTADGRKFWTPPTHINCRCDVVLDLSVTEDIQAEISELLARESVTKARPGDPFDRDRRGRFSRAEARDSRPFKEREAEVDALLAQVNEALRVPVGTREETVETKAPKLEGIKLGGTSSMSLKAPSLNAVKLTAPTEQAQPTGIPLKGTRLKNPELKEASVPTSVKLTGIEPQLIPNSPILTKQGRWHPMDEVLTTIFKPEDAEGYDVTDLMLIDGDKTFFEEHSYRPSHGDADAPTLNSSIGDYWEDWIKGQMTQYWSRRSLNQGHFLYEDEYGYLSIGPDEYREVLDALVEGAGRGQMVWLEDPLKGEDDPDKHVEVEINKIIQNLDLIEQIEQDMPVLVQVRHGLPGLTEHIKANEWVNPGLWRVVNVRYIYSEENGDLHHLPYKVLEAIPADLEDAE